ncbi:hypothetical protein HII36_47825 [Nonomuraea sp. NN258]|uniref:hypothetical protein n=1 Tax=Nonomuraea antri TaxID=2730852 RepID=UPI001569CE70|nr:hypothetical protein [Nonomuraea antri]NRQ39487.1 hypothetical protein [Nonomuraea antri]
MRLSAKTALSAVAAAGCLLTATPAVAAVPAGNAPMCVTVWHTTGRITKTGYARNDCEGTLKLKIVWAHGGDGACHTVQPGWTISSQIPRGPRTFDGANLC